MAKFLNSAKVSSQVPKLVEAKDGYIFNGVYYDKTNLIAESLEDLTSFGAAKSLSLNRVASYPVIGGTEPSAAGLTIYRGETIIEDEYEKGVYYTVTFDQTQKMITSHASITKYKEESGEIKKVNQNKYENTQGDNYYGTMTDYIGQSKDYLIFICDLCYHYSSTRWWNRSGIAVVNKQDLIMTRQNTTTSDRTSYSKIANLGTLSYILEKCPGKGAIIREFNNDTLAMKTIKTFPVLLADKEITESVISNFCHEVIMTSNNDGYLIDIPFTSKENLTCRKYDFKFSNFYQHYLNNGYPVVKNLREEASYKLMNYSCASNYSPCPVLDKDNVNGISDKSTGVFYWSGASHYLDITLNEETNIWRSGTKDFATATYSNKLLIHKYNEETEEWEDITEDITQTVTPLNNLQWEKSIANLPAGRYSFKYSARRMDSCWYLESVGGKFIGKQMKGLWDANSVKSAEIDIISTDEEYNTIQLSGSSWRVCSDMFVTDAVGEKYINLVTYGLSATNWDQGHEKSCMLTFKMDHEANNLILVSHSPLSNSVQVCKSFVVNNDGTKLIGMSATNTFILQFNSLKGCFEPLKYFSFSSFACGFDKNENIWILDNSYRLLKYNETIPENINIIFEDKPLDFEGEDVETYINIDSKNLLGKNIKSNISLAINGKAIFKDNGLNEIEVTTASEAIQIPIIIKGSGSIMIYPTLLLDIKEN